MLKKVKTLLSRNKNILWLYYILNYYFSRLRFKEPLIVFQMGKVGSSTVTKSLGRIKSYGPIYQVHYLTDKGIIGNEKANGFNQWGYRFLNDKIKSSSGKRWKVISLVREPVGRNISAYFQNIDFVFEGFVSDYNNKLLTIDDCKNHFIKHYNHDIPLNWFDSEMKSVFKVDVFASDFPKLKGYKIYRNEKVELLIVKLEKLNICAKEAFSEFLGLKDFSLLKANIGIKKDYSSAYSDFLNSSILPGSYLEKMYSSQYMRHFYSEEEISIFKAKWRRERLNKG